MGGRETPLYCSFVEGVATCLSCSFVEGVETSLYCLGKGFGGI
jgi:hypothetical protein